MEKIHYMRKCLEGAAAIIWVFLQAAALSGFPISGVEIEAGM
jgi:hypothetical protein